MTLEPTLALARSGELYPSCILHGADERSRREAALEIARTLLCARPPAERPCARCSHCRRIVWGDGDGGLNLYLGQQPQAGGLFTTLAGLDQAREPSGESYLERRLGRAIDGPAAADRVWYGEALRTVRERPLAAVASWLRTIWLHLQAWSMAQVTPLSHWPEEAPVLRALPVPWWLLVVLGGGGAALTLRSRPTWPWPCVGICGRAERTWGWW